MRVLVTGGAGYIGSHTAKLLLSSGFEPVLLDNLSTGHREAARWGALVVGDLADCDLLRAVIRDHAVEAVVHFAANAIVGESMADPRKYFHNNVVNTLGLLEGMLDTEARTFVFSSSCAIYGVPRIVPIAEDHPQEPVNPYGESKLFVERVLNWYAQAYGIRWMALRYFNAAGADLEGEIGEAHDPETHLIPLAIQAATGQMSHLEIYGTDYPTPDGSAIRDYVHVVDLARAHVAALAHLVHGGVSMALNLGTGRGTSVREVVHAIEHETGLSVPVRSGKRRPGDPPELLADAGLARHVLNWTPVYSDLKTIISSAWNWHSCRTRPPR